jgi:hypothetical protein
MGIRENATLWLSEVEISPNTVLIILIFAFVTPASTCDKIALNKPKSQKQLYPGVRPCEPKHKKTDQGPQCSKQHDRLPTYLITGPSPEGIHDALTGKKGSCY